MYDSSVAAARRITESSLFQNFIIGVILANAIVLGLETYDSIRESAGATLDLLNDIFLGIFVVEILTRVHAHGRRPQEFFKSGWNVFDFMVVGAAFLPGLRQNATALRLVRLFRVFRLVSTVPEMRVLVSTMGRSMRPIGHLALFGSLIMYIYAMLGWVLFSKEDPQHWGTVGKSMLNLFIVLTLENWPNLLDAAEKIYPWAWVYFVSYVLIATFLLLNVLIGVVLNSMEEARAEDRRAHSTTAQLEVDEQLQLMRDTLDDLQARLDAERIAHRHGADVSVVSRAAEGLEPPPKPYGA